MSRIFKDNLKKITALVLVGAMTITPSSSAFAKDNVIQDVIAQDDNVQDKAIIVEDTLSNEKEDEIRDELMEEVTLSDDIEDKTSNESKKESTLSDEIDDELSNELVEEESTEETEVDILSSIEEDDEEARERECMPGSPDYLKKFLTYLSLEYPQIGIDPEYGTGVNPIIDESEDYNLHNYYNATKMARQTAYNRIEIDGNKHPEITRNMVQFRFLSNFDGDLGAGVGDAGYNYTVKTLVIRNVDEIRNLSIPASVEELIIENTTLNCYYWENDSPTFQNGSGPGKLKYCKNLKKLVLKDVKFGDNYKHPELEKGTWGKCGYEQNYVLDLQNSPNLEELEIDVSFAGAREIQLAINGGTENLFENLTKDNCKINPAPGTGYEQVMLYANEASNLAKFYKSSETVKFKNGLFRIWLIEALGIDTNHDGVISQDEMDAIETLTINDQTARSIEQSSLSSFQELADIGQMHGLKTLVVDFYNPDGGVFTNNNRQILKGIDFPDSLENLSIENVYWEKDTQSALHDNADIVLTNLKTLKLYNTEVKDGAFDHPPVIKLTDTEGVLQSCIIDNTDFESIELINNSDGKGIINDDEKQRIRFSASNCAKLKAIEFSGEGYAVEGGLDLTEDSVLTHIGVPNEGKTLWTVYGEFDSTEAPINVILNGCTKLASECSEIVIDYDFINGRNLNVQTMNTDFKAGHDLTIKRQPRIDGDRAGDVYLSCDENGWLYGKYNGQPGFVIEQRSSFPTIAVFSSGQNIRTSAEGQHNNESPYTEETDRWVERRDLVMSPGGYSSNFGNLTFYVVDKVDGVDVLRRVYYKDPVYVEWDYQNDSESIITLPTATVQKGENTHYELTGGKLSSTGIPGRVTLKLYVLKDDNKSYIGYQDIKIFKMPDSVELVSDGTKRGSGTKDDPFILDKKSNEELKLKARLLVDGKVDESDNAPLRDVYWRIKEYDEVPKYTSDKDGYSLYTLDSATKAGISVVRGELNSGETEAAYDKRIDTAKSNYYSHRIFAFNTEGTKYKIVAQSPYKNNDEVILSEVYVEISDKPLTIDISNDNKLIHGKGGWDETTITISDVDAIDFVDVSIENQESYEDCFIVARDSSSTDSKDVWKLKINSSDISKIKEVIDREKIIKLVITADDKQIKKVISLSSVFPKEDDLKDFWCSEIEDQIYTGKAIKPKLNIYNGKLQLVEGKDYSLAYGNNVDVRSKDAVNVKGKNIGPFVTITGKGNYSDKQTYYFSIVPCSIESRAKVDDIIVANTGKDIKIAPIVTLDGKKLKQGTDYVVSTTEYEEDEIVSFKDPQDYTLYVIGKGNYTGAVSFRFTITESILSSKVSIQKIADQNYNDGAEISPDIKITYNGKNVTDCFNIKYENNIEIGTATVVVTSKKTFDKKDFIGEAGYSFNGSKKATFKIKGLNITDTKLGINGRDKMPEFIYSGAKHKPQINNLYYKTGKEPLVEGKDFTVTYSQNLNAGTATALITGEGKYTGTKKLTYKINKYDAGKDIDNVITINDGNDISVCYEKGGVTPKPKVSMNGVALTEKKDYTLSYANNKAVAGADAVNSRGKSVAPTIVVNFKGNFSGKRSVAFTITAKNITPSIEGEKEEDKIKITLADKPVSTRKDAWKQTAATIVDTNGKKLAAGTDYNKTFEYYSDSECSDENKIIDEVLDTTKLINNTVYVKITGINNYEGSTVGSYRISKINISAVSATISNQTYTGVKICPPVGDIVVTVGSGNNKTTLTADKDYEVVSGSYTNNVNKGTANVTIRGKGDYYGTKVVKYEIGVNKILWWIW